MTEQAFAARDEVSFDQLDSGAPQAASDYRHLPSLPPGVFLAAMVEWTDRADLCGHDLVYLMQARMRLISYLQAELYRDMTELGYCPPSGPGDPPTRVEEFDEHTSEEIRAALV